MISMHPLFDKKNWNKVTLNEVVTKEEENDKVAAHSRFDRFVKVEHMDAGSQHLKRWASQENGDEINPTFYKVFRKGQILYPTRNPHLKRAVVAPFDGICGEKTLTLKPKNDYVIPGFLPFLFHSDSFYNHAVSSIIGSTNPHVRWRDISNFEFYLPTKQDQDVILQLLKSSDEQLERLVNLSRKLEITLSTTIEKEIHGINIHGRTINQVLAELVKKCELRPLSELGQIFKGKGIPKADVVSEGIPCVRYGEIYTFHNKVVRKYNSFVNQSKAAKSFKVMKGDVLFASSGETIKEIGKSASIIHSCDAYAGSDIIIFRPFDMDCFYSGYLFNSLLVRKQLDKLGTGATVMHVYGDDLKKIRVPMHSPDRQKVISHNLEAIYKNIELTEEQIFLTRSINRGLINKVF